MLRRATSPLHLLLLLALASLSREARALSLDEKQGSPDDETLPHPGAAAAGARPSLKQRLAEVLIGSCSLGAAAAGSMLCASAGPLAGGGYLAAGASGLVTALQMRKTRAADHLARAANELEQQNRMLTSSAVEMKQELDTFRSAVAGVRAGGEEFASSLWRAVQGTQPPLAASLDRSERLELLSLLKDLNSDTGGAPLSEQDLLAAEHYMLRTIPQRSLQALILASSRASVSAAKFAGATAGADGDADLQPEQAALGAPSR